MAMTQFMMVEELASLIKDNLFSKHLVLSTEETLINFLQDSTSLEGVLELQPMSPYNRLLLHRLADIYGFSHISVGEGEDRHLVFERCPDTSIPTVLVSDILWQYDEYQSPASSQHILRRTDSPVFIPATEASETPSFSTPLEEREAAYLAARERIFSQHLADENEAVAPKSRNIPVAARRMIAHALGKRISNASSNHSHPSQKYEANERTVGPKMESDSWERKANDKPGGRRCDGRQAQIKWERKAHDKPGDGSCNGRQAQNKAASSACSNGEVSANERSGRIAGTGNQERDQIGAAKRIFAHALGLSSTKGNTGLGLAVKSHVRNRSFSQDM